MEYECKTITQWVKDPRCPLKKLQLWKAIQAKRLPASRPIGSRSWLVKWSDLEDYLTGVG